MEIRDERPYVYSALNSHALYVRGADLGSDAMIDHNALESNLGIQWFPIDDSVTHGSAMKQDSSNGTGPIDFDT